MRGLVGVLVFVCGCAGPPPAPPTALIDADPRAVCRGDEFSTLIELSGARSAGALSLVPAPPDPGAPPLEFTWSLEGAEYTVAAGSVLEPGLSVYASGDRPLHVTLTVMNGDGGEATSVTSIGIDDCPP